MTTRYNTLIASGNPKSSPLPQTTNFQDVPRTPVTPGIINGGFNGSVGYNNNKVKMQWIDSSLFSPKPSDLEGSSNYD